MSLRDCFQDLVQCRTNVMKREYLWRSFHKLSSEVLPCKWKSLFTTLGVQEKHDQLLCQTINTVLFEDMLIEYFEKPFEMPKSDRSDTEFSKDELNAIRYASVYVPMSLRKKFELRTSNKYRQYKYCLGNMAVNSSEDSEETDFSKYTSEWFERVNRGGLFPVNDLTLAFFIAIEKVTRNRLVQHKQRCALPKQETIDLISKNSDVKLYWSTLAQDIEKEQDANELLSSIAEKWVTMRGFSLVSYWLEEYKQIKKTKVSKQKGLRKELCKKSNPLTREHVAVVCSQQDDRDCNMISMI